MRVLALASYPVEAAATRFRLSQFVAPLSERGITLDIRPFLSSRQFDSFYQQRWVSRTALGLSCSLVRRIRDLAAAQTYDAVLVQREAMLLGPPIVEYLISQILRKPMLLDLDDATYIRYRSPTHGRVANLLKCFGKTDELIRWSRIVTCGNRTVADYVSRLGSPTLVIPTVVDLDVYCPRPEYTRSEPPVLGWIGSHSTFPYLASIFPALERLARRRRFRLKVVGSGRETISVDGVEVESLPWRMEREIEDFRSLDIGLYPIVDDGWSVGKSAFKAIEYMAIGIPHVVSPVGACAEVGEVGVTHFEARSEDDWLTALESLLGDESLRTRMGEAGRLHALKNFDLHSQADRLASAIRYAVGLASSPVPGDGSGAC